MVANSAPHAERFELYIFIADAKHDDDDCRYVVEYWFVDRPGIETIAGLFDEAKLAYRTLYPDAELANFSVGVRRLRGRDFAPATTAFGC